MRPTLKILAREEAPPLTDILKWASFPYKEYDLVIIDSLDASTEGVGAQDSAQPSKAIAAVLDIVRKEDGPAIWILGNTVKSGKNYRGSGVIGDRADIIYEVRDATDLKPSGGKAWWQDLPDAGESAWADRASRREQRESFRLAFIPSKFRVGAEPEPFCLQINAPKEGKWTLVDVTEELKQLAATSKGRKSEERKAQRRKAVRILVAEIKRAMREGKPINKSQAEDVLVEKGHLRRKEARKLIPRLNNKRWWLKELDDERGKPKLLLPLANDRPGHKTRRK